MGLKDKSYTKQSRKELAEAGTTEVSMREEIPGIDELWREIQDLRQQMNEEKKKAAKKAAEPFLEKIKDLENQIAFVAKLSS